MNQIFFSHPTGNANVRAAATGLAEAGILKQFYTTLAVFPDTLAYKLGAKGPLAELRRRMYDAALQPYTKTYPYNELSRMIASKLGWQKLVQHEVGRFSVDKVYQQLDKRVANAVNSLSKKEFDATYAYEDGALATFKAAKQNKIACLYDLPIGYWRAMHRLLKAEQITHPEWAATLTGFKDSAAKLARKDEELRLADHIFVASSFTAATLQEYPGQLAPVTVIPYGFPKPVMNRTYSPLQNRPLRILFVGGLSQRKGIANLFEAVEKFGSRVELTVVGNKSVQDCTALDAALAKHRWIPSLPHAEILMLMQQFDVFIFPSLFEGFGLVITEAMSQGTPVITTERTAGPDLITHNENGWLTQAGSTIGLQEAIENLLLNPTQLKNAGMAAIETALQRPWSVYGQELVAKITSLNA